MKAPSSNIQAPEKRQAPNFNQRDGGFGAWDLIFLWCLDVGAWRFFASLPFS
jgi:hypothetical protein